MIFTNKAIFFFCVLQFKILLLSQITLKKIIIILIELKKDKSNISHIYLGNFKIDYERGSCSKILIYILNECINK